MAIPNQLAAALRYMEMAADQKKIAKAREAFKTAHKLDLTETYREAERELIASRS
jgi:hypothetical protein